jgi:hypothetical protein
MATSKPKLTVAKILRWADAHHAATGRWPGAASGPVPGTAGESWRAVNLSLRNGYRGLPGGDSLARLLVRHGRVARWWADCCTWTAEEDELPRRLTAAEAARRTGRSVDAVYARRQRLRGTHRRTRG